MNAFLPYIPDKLVIGKTNNNVAQTRSIARFILLIDFNPVLMIGETIINAIYGATNQYENGLTLICPP